MTRDSFEERPPARRVPSRVLCGHRWLPVDVLEWDPTPEGAALRLMRKAKGVTVRRAAAAVGLTMRLWSAIETGQFAPVDPALWAVLRAAVVTAERHDREGGAP